MLMQDGTSGRQRWALVAAVNSALPRARARLAGGPPEDEVVPEEVFTRFGLVDRGPLRDRQ